MPAEFWVLGFHSPYIDANVSTDNKLLVSKAYREGVRAIGQLLEHDWDDYFPKALLVDMLKTEPEDVLFADTIARVAAWEIQLIGYRSPAPLTVANLEWACINDTRARKNRWMSRWWGNLDALSGTSSQQLKTKPNTEISFVANKYRAELPGFGSEESYTCTADAYRAGAKIYLALNFDGGEPVPPKGALEKAVKAENWFLTRPIWMAYPSDQKIKEIIE
jgi:hypothetical protein